MILINARRSNKRTAPPKAKVSNSSNSEDNYVVGMRYQSASDEQIYAEKLVSFVIESLFQQLQHTHIDEFETEDGKFRNVDINVRPPSTEDIFFKYNNTDDSSVIVVRNIGINADTDMDLDNLYGTTTGHTNLIINNLDVDIETIPKFEKGEQNVEVNYHMHINDADVSVHIVNSDIIDQLPEEIESELVSPFEDIQASFKIATTNMVDSTIEKMTGNIVQNYFEKLKNPYILPHKVMNEINSDRQLTFEALPFKTGDDKTFVVDYDTKSNLISSGKRVSERLQNSLKDIRYDQSELEMIKSDLRKHHIFIAPNAIRSVTNNLDLSDTSFKLSKQKKVQDKVKEYFGSDVELECYNHENDLPQYRSDNDTITGEQIVKCVLHPKGQGFDPLFEIDLNFTFTIHPTLDEDGKSLKAEFGKIQATYINTHDKKVEIATQISDKLDINDTDDFFIGQVDSFIPFLLKGQFSIGGQEEFEKEALNKFTDMLKAPGLVDIPQLEKQLFPSFSLPVPLGHKFKNTEISVLKNGVIDISGDLEAE